MWGTSSAAEKVRRASSRCRAVPLLRHHPQDATTAQPQPQTISGGTLRARCQAKIAARKECNAWCDLLHPALLLRSYQREPTQGALASLPDVFVASEDVSPRCNRGIALE